MKKILLYLFGIAIFVGWVIANYFLFNHFLKVNYFKWFIENGSFISIITGVIYIFRDEFKDDIGLISDHPLDFLGAQMQVFALFLLPIGNGIKGSKTTNIIDRIITLIIILPLIVICIVWFLVVIPCQYFLFFICGAPSRLFETSKIVTSVERNSKNKKNDSHIEKSKFTLDIKEKPFEFTNSIAALVLFVLSQVLFN